MRIFTRLSHLIGRLTGAIGDWRRYVGEFGRVGLTTVTIVVLLVALGETAVPGIVVNRFAPSWLIGCAIVCVMAQAIEARPQPRQKWHALTVSMAALALCLVAWYQFDTMDGRLWTASALAVLLLGGAILYRFDHR